MHLYIILYAYIHSLYLLITWQKLFKNPFTLRTNLIFSLNRTSPSQADVAVFNGVSKSPDAGKYPHAARWYKHIASFADEFTTLPGDASAPASTYGPEVAAAAVNPAAAPATEAEDDDEVDLFGSDEEEEDPEKEALTQKRLAEYAAKKVSIMLL